MARVTRLDLRAPDQAWRHVDMPGANLGIDLVPLQASDGTFAILGCFPAGFERPGPGGYLVAEEFLVVDGALELEGTVVERGALGFVPARCVRTLMRSPGGCTVLAWFGGPADYRPAAELSGCVGTGMQIVAALDARRGSVLLHTDEARWEIADVAGQPLLDRTADVVDLDLHTWARVGPGDPVPIAADRLLLRTPADPLPAP